MLGLPQSTEVNRRVAKEKLYANATLAPQLRDMIKDQIEAIIWRNKLTAQRELARQIAGGRLEMLGDIDEAVNCDKHR